MRNPGSAGLTADRLGDAEPWEGKPRKVSDRLSVGGDVGEQARTQENGEIS